MVIPGQLAIVDRSDDRPYAQGLHFLARIMRETLGHVFFYRRLTKQLKGGSLQGLDYEQARFSHIATFDAIVVNVTKCIEQRGDTWNLDQLFKEWRKYEHEEAKGKEVLAAIERLRVKFEWLEQFRHRRAAHQTKDDEVTMLTSLPDDIRGIAELVEVLDMFVEGQIPYPLYLHESSMELDLRKELGL